MKILHISIKRKYVLFFFETKEICSKSKELCLIPCQTGKQYNQVSVDSGLLGRPTEGRFGTKLALILLITIVSSELLGSLFQSRAKV